MNSHNTQSPLAMIQSARRKPDDASIVQSVLQANLRDTLNDFYAQLGKTPGFSDHVNDPGMVDKLKGAQAAHWSKVFSKSVPDDLAAHSERVGQVHADIGISSSAYVSAYGWFLVRLVGPLVRQCRFRPGALEIGLETLLSRAFVDMVGAMAAYETGVESRQSSAAERGRNFQNLQNLAGTVVDVNEVTIDLAHLSRNTSEVSSSAQTIAAAVVEMAASVEEIAHASEGAVDETTQADETTARGRAAVSEVNDAILKIAAAVDETSSGVEALTGASEQIGQILGVIRGIAAQTNLLALNATIEAARAGDAGKGFAVVASEVKELSSQTTKATEDINHRIGALLDGMSVIQNAMVNTRSAVSLGQTSIFEAAQTMDGIADQVGSVSVKMRDISTVLHQQSEATNEIGRSIERVALTAVESERLLQDMSSKLHASNDRFAESAKTWFVAESHTDLCEMAKIDHVLFKKRVIDVLMGRESWAANDVPDHHGCRLGKWYDSIKDPAVRNHPAFEALSEPHSRFHKIAREVLEAHANKDSDAAYEALDRLNEVSAVVISLLEKISQGGRNPDRVTPIRTDDMVGTLRSARNALGQAGVAQGPAGSTCCPHPAPRRA